MLNTRFMLSMFFLTQSHHDEPIPHIVETWQLLFDELILAMSPADLHELGDRMWGSAVAGLLRE